MMLFKEAWKASRCRCHIKWSPFTKVLQSECKHDRFIYRIVTLNDSGIKNVLSLELFFLYILSKLEFEEGKEICEGISLHMKHEENFRQNVRYKSHNRFSLKNRKVSKYWLKSMVNKVPNQLSKQCEIFSLYICHTFKRRFKRFKNLFWEVCKDSFTFVSEIKLWISLLERLKLL